MPDIGSLQLWIAAFELLTKPLILAGGAFGLFLAWKRVNASNKQADAQIRQADAQIRQANLQIRQATLTRRGHVVELFNRAVGQLSDSKFEIRFGAILTLGQIRQEFPDFADPVVKLLTTHLRQNLVDYADKEPPADVQEIIDILSRPLEVTP